MNVFDVILAGGGLGNGLIALALKSRRPQLRIALVEAGERLGGDHTWSFHGTDIADADNALMAPMVRKSWSAQDVVFPRLRRTLDTSYHTVTSDLFHAYVSKTLGAQAVYTKSSIVEVTGSGIRLADGRAFSAACVIDGRGWDGQIAESLALAFQKFVGLEIETSSPHGLSHPIIMDATVPQTDGYRFVYCLPFSERSLLVEDTYYSDTAAFDRGSLTNSIHAYVDGRGWSISNVLREEAGCLPIVLAGRSTEFDKIGNGAASAGLRAGLFHPTTGYSLPDALRLAKTIAASPELTTAVVKACTVRLRDQLWREREFYRMLNRLLFVAARGEERRNVMERFYGLPRELIERFYAGRTTTFDKLRIMSGRPPLPIGRAAGAISDRAAWDFAARTRRFAQKRGA